MKEKNNEINILKFIFAIIIMLLHSKNMLDAAKIFPQKYFFANGSIAVEFFFIVSGYFMAKTCLRGGKTPEYFLYKRIKSFILPSFCSWLVAFALIHIVRKNQGMYQIFIDAVNSIYEILFLRNAGFVGKYYNGVTWYLSALLLSMAVIVIPLFLLKEKYIYIIAPLISVFFLGYLSQTFQSIRNPNKWIGVMYKCQLRAIAEVHLGIFLYGIIQKIKHIELTTIGKILLTLVEFILYSGVILFMQVGSVSRLDFSVIIFMAFAILISLWQKTYFSYFADAIYKIADVLEELSLYIYLNQKVWTIVLPITCAGMSYKEMICVYVICVFLTACIIMILVKYLRKYVLPYIKKLIIV